MFVQKYVLLTFIFFASQRKRGKRKAALACVFVFGGWKGRKPTQPNNNLNVMICIC
jgi:hypothetical protein